MTDKQTNRQTDGHGDSMTDPAQRAESVKILQDLERPKPVQISLFYNCLCYILTFRNAGAVNTSEEEIGSVTK